MILARRYLKIFCNFIILIIVFSCDRFFRDQDFYLVKSGNGYTVFDTKNREYSRIDIFREDFKSSIVCCDEIDCFRVLYIPEDGFYNFTLIDGNDSLVTYKKYIEATDSNYFEITFLDVKQGDCTIIKGMDGKITVVDGGYGSYSSGLGNWAGSGEKILVNYLIENNYNSIYNLIITHDDMDHKGGILDVLNDDRFVVGNFYDGSVSDLLEGDFLDIGNSEKSIVLNPPSNFPNFGSNNGSIVLGIDYLDFSLLLTGDIENEGEEWLLDMDYVDDIDLLKLAHHGSKYSSSESFLSISLPESVIISSGKGNPYNHPHPNVIKRLNGKNIFRTDTDGTIKVLTDGYNYQTIFMR
ncbi:MAG: hypothetical protein CR982_02580 [Candidatus Cloacimonadota bacterium]|nr:MAG: hypothetical protein CR982_02580 [Candidatus Cloacimonadota bacterium]PIE79316.1 MAG: hypothetical protein CSA15_03435 [Candidatus Delongbacteria bacterium]